MMNRMTLLWRCIVGPTLYSRYLQKPIGQQLQDERMQQQQQHHQHHGARHYIEYEPNRMESMTSTAITGTMFVFRLMYALWPLLVPVLWRRGYFCRDGALYVSKTAIACLIFLLPVYFMRGVARFLNEDYVRFIRVLNKAQEQRAIANSPAASDAMEALRLYDFEFHEWPVDFAISQEVAQSNPTLFDTSEPEEVRVNPIQYWLNSLLANIVGVRMIYPGCTGLINAMVGPQLVIERAKWLTERNGRRYKVRTALGDEIDTCFVDRRNEEGSTNGQTLVICSEGNAGFWEVGALTTPNPLGYSLLGWNHPGFAGSSGWPFPANDRAAVAAVYHFATTQLGFSSQDIVLFAWSIGGYTSSWLASVANPPVRAVILDATFDNIEALARRQMPQILHPLVISTIKTHFNLHVANNLKKYPGPVLFVRRTRDEIISLVPGQLETNCINHLIVSTLRHRYPALVPNVDLSAPSSGDASQVDIETVDKLYGWLSEALEVQTMLNFKDRSDCRDYIKSFAEKVKQQSGKATSKAIESQLGADMPLEFRHKLLAYVLLNCVKDFSATHCTPLPEDFFRIPTPLI